MLDWYFLPSIFGRGRGNFLFSLDATLYFLLCGDFVYLRARSKLLETELEMWSKLTHDLLNVAVGSRLQ